MSTQSVSFLDVLEALVTPVQSKPNYEKGKGSNQGFLAKKALKCNVEGKNGQIDLKGAQG